MVIKKHLSFFYDFEAFVNDLNYISKFVDLSKFSSNQFDENFVN